ncbi:MAG: isoleucine--tRNA ligase [Crocinitomicaceae bacterium]|nr:isoleucine--tRNA ligase [Crocinitomicaceae bacterium]|tara:strand:- start:20569 stop:23958 length:3390 start_codon:yes stop_codon:yes gene_type:complete
MEKKYPEYKQLNLSQVADEMLEVWKREKTFEQSIETRKGKEPYVFYEGPPSANGLPGIHHVMARTIKDIFCRYKTIAGFQVKRKAGWDTHGLPVELGVEKELGITKEDIGKKISVQQYNDACRKAVMRYTDVWNDLTEKMGYWVDMDDPYITYENKYIESVWNILSELYKKDFLYKGYTIQPYSPKAGTGLSTHELNQPGTYRDVKDTTIIAQFRVIQNERSNRLFENTKNEVFFLAWTTTPWTLPSNTALTVGKNIQYAEVETINQYTRKPISVILASDLVAKYFNADMEGKSASEYNGKGGVPWKKADEFSGADLVNAQYEQLLPYTLPMDNPEEAFRVIAGDFVTTVDGTGIVHTAPTFGADDARVAKVAGVPPMLVEGEGGQGIPLVDLQGRFIDQMGDLAGKYVKNEYYDAGKTPDMSVDVEIAIRLKEENRAFKVEKYVHNYPHCWRTDKPILYYPLDSWFVKTTAAKSKLIENNKKINWKPKSTGEGRFGNWLENLQDWNLSRSRYWGIPIPIWSNEDGTERIIIGSVEELKAEIKKAVDAGVMDNDPFADFEVGNMSKANYDTIDLHKHIVDDIVLVSESGQPMRRESDLIDVWFDSGSMPYAQWHYPFENKEVFEQNYPADFIAEGVDQTRGWFFTLHAIATLAYDSIAYKNVISNGLVLDKNGHKMSKRLGNAADPFETLKKYGADATRWYMITNAQPWDNLKFDLEGIVEIQRKFFRALHNTYSFFALYANVDGFKFEEDYIEVASRPEIDRWILSKLNSLVKTVSSSFDNYEPTQAGRLIQDFVVNDLSNWWVRLCRKRFWRGDYSEDKIAAYQTIYECLKTVAVLSSPIAPFYSDKLYRDLNSITANDAESVHISLIPEVNESLMDGELESRMELAQRASSLVLALRKKQNIRVRQPLGKILIPVSDETFKSKMEKVTDVILNEVNVKEIEFIDPNNELLVKQIKPNFSKLGRAYGKQMKALATLINGLSQEQIKAIEFKGELEVELEGQLITLTPEDVEIGSKDVPGWLVASEANVTVALDITITDDLKFEGLGRELVNRIQNLRKDSGLEVTDRINVKVAKNDIVQNAINYNLNYIRTETLSDNLDLVEGTLIENGVGVELEEGIDTIIKIEKV